MAIEERNREKRRAALETILRPKPIEPFAVPKVTPVDSTDESREEPEAHVLPAEKKQEFVFVTAEANSAPPKEKEKSWGKRAESRKRKREARLRDKLTAATEAVETRAVQGTTTT